MLTDIKDQSNYTEQNIFLINDEPVMKNALEVLTILGKTGKIIIKECVKNNINNLFNKLL